MIDFSDVLAIMWFASGFFGFIVYDKMQRERGNFSLENPILICMWALTVSFGGLLNWYDTIKKEMENG